MDLDSTTIWQDRHHPHLPTLRLDLLGCRLPSQSVRCAGTDLQSKPHSQSSRWVERRRGRISDPVAQGLLSLMGTVEGLPIRDTINALQSSRLADSSEQGNEGNLDLPTNACNGVRAWGQERALAGFSSLTISGTQQGVVLCLTCFSLSARLRVRPRHRDFLFSPTPV